MATCVHVWSGKREGLARYIITLGMQLLQRVPDYAYILLSLSLLFEFCVFLRLAAALATHSSPPSIPTSTLCTAGAMVGAVRASKNRLAQQDQCVTMCSPCVHFKLVRICQIQRILRLMTARLASMCLMNSMTVIISVSPFQSPSLELDGP